jgi:hypothetical protein
MAIPYYSPEYAYAMSETSWYHGSGALHHIDGSDLYNRDDLGFDTKGRGTCKNVDTPTLKSILLNVRKNTKLRKNVCTSR